MARFAFTKWARGKKLIELTIFPTKPPTIWNFYEFYEREKTPTNFAHTTVCRKMNMLDLARLLSQCIGKEVHD